MEELYEIVANSKGFELVRSQADSVAVWLLTIIILAEAMVVDVTIVMAMKIPMYQIKVTVMATLTQSIISSILIEMEL